VGHVLRVKEERAQKEALKEHIDGRRLVGRPKGRWIDAVEKDAKSTFKCKK
jgi:hypothetical protein